MTDGTWITLISLGVTGLFMLGVPVFLVIAYWVLGCRGMSGRVLLTPLLKSGGSVEIKDVSSAWAGSDFADHAAPTMSSSSPQPPRTSESSQRSSQCRRRRPQRDGAGAPLLQADPHLDAATSIEDFFNGISPKPPLSSVKELCNKRSQNIDGRADRLRLPRGGKTNSVIANAQQTQHFPIASRISTNIAEKGGSKR